MEKKELIRYVFASSNTSQGFHTFIPDLIADLEKVYILKGAPGTGKSTFIRTIGEMMLKQGFEVEFWISALETLSPDGVYLPQLGIAVVNGSLPQPIDPKYPGAKEYLVNMDECWDKASIEARYQEIIQLVDVVDFFRSKAYQTLREASRVKANIRRIYSAYLNMGNLEDLIESLATEILEKPCQDKHYYASIITADGLSNYIDELSQGCRQRYILKGPSGSGKSTLITELARRARQRGFFLEYYHCGLDADSLVMLIIRNLQVALVEAGEIEIIPRPADVVVDMNSCLDNYNQELIANQVNQSYRDLESLLYQAQQELANAEQGLKEIKKIFAGSMDFGRLETKRLEVTEEIQKHSGISTRG